MASKVTDFAEGKAREGNKAGPEEYSTPATGKAGEYDKAGKADGRAAPDGWPGDTLGQSGTLDRSNKTDKSTGYRK